MNFGLETREKKQIKEGDGRDTEIYISRLKFPEKSYTQFETYKNSNGIFVSPTGGLGTHPIGHSTSTKSQSSAAM